MIFVIVIELEFIFILYLSGQRRVEPELGE